MEQLIGILLYTLIYMTIGMLFWKVMNFISGFIITAFRKLYGIKEK